ncbi:MAG: three-Cys-motif partner protein TcmP [Candidatus Omnitrophota bacterium]|jgi:three-Cys-motif partner protein
MKKKESEKQKTQNLFCVNELNAMRELSIAEPMQQFGGGWTEVKLDLLQKYLAAYTTALKRQTFAKMYIDAFAGTGYREIETKDDSPGLFAEQIEAESEGFFDGSTRLALQVNPAFDRYVFIEESPKRLEELRAVSLEFSALAGKMDFRQGDANIILPKLCQETDWKATRAVLFLDPFGMSVDWKTMRAIAHTKAIDVWILFPAGVGVNRLLTVDPKNMPRAWKDRLDRIFGTSDWFRRFYCKQKQGMLFGDEQPTSKVGDPVQAIAQFYQERLREIFPKVASNPRYLCNSKQSPMFIFTFAIGNPKLSAQKLAMKIAEYILGKVK